MNKQYARKELRILASVLETLIDRAAEYANENDEISMCETLDFIVAITESSKRVILEGPAPISSKPSSSARIWDRDTGKTQELKILE